MTISGTLTAATNAPARIARPPRTSTKVDTQAVTSGSGAPICSSSLANPAGPRLSLAHPWAMNPYPITRRSGSGAHCRHNTPSPGLSISASGLNDCSQNHDHLPAGLIFVHHPVRLADVLEPEDT